MEILALRSKRYYASAGDPDKNDEEDEYEDKEDVELALFVVFCPFLVRVPPLHTGQLANI